MDQVGRGGGSHTIPVLFAAATAAQGWDVTAVLV